MAPMARTNRKDSALNALDDLDLDDMFEGGQDGLFDELGMDLGELGDITDNGGSDAAAPPAPDALDGMKFDLLGDIGVDDGATSGSPEQPLKKSKRKAKRKIKGSPPSDDEDEDDEEPSKKKRRYTKKTKVSTKKSKAPEPEPPSPIVTTPRKSKSKISAVSSSTLERSSSSSMVAAAGQFGGRHKRGNYPLLSRGSSKSKMKAGVVTSAAAVIPSVSTVTPVAPIVAASKSGTISAAELVPPPSSIKRNRSIVEVSKPIETLFCGLEPSNTLFYPFLPTLPPEVSMKKCNKHYPTLDRINIALNSTTPGPDMDDPLLKLLMFHDPVPTKEKKLLMAAAVASSRTLAQSVDKPGLVADLQAAATLVKRQHDFLAQSLDNMERWCKTCFSGDDYRAVYGGEKPKPLIAQLTSPIVRVKIRCNGFKEPKMNGVLIAQVPIPGSIRATTSQPSTTSTKRKKVDPSAPSSDKTATDRPVLHYADMPPAAQRQRLIELVAKHGQLLETKWADMDESRRKALEKQHLVLQKVVDEDNLLALNTMTLWKWIEKAGYFADFTEQDLDELLTYQPEVSEEHILWEGTATKKKASSVRDSLYFRLQSLLVEVSGDEDNDDTDDEADDDAPLWEYDKGTNERNELVNVSELTLEERAYLHLRAAGLLDESRPPPEEPVDEPEEHIDEESYEFEEVLRRMKTDLVQVDRLNNARTAFLDSSARAHFLLGKQAKRLEERHSQMVSKVNQLLRKQKEHKRSARQKVQKKDEDWIPCSAR